MLTQVIYSFDIQQISTIRLNARCTTYKLISLQEKHEYCFGHIYLSFFSSIVLQSIGIYICRVKWKKIWYLHVPPKVQMIFWLLLNDVLHYKLNLQCRGVHTDLLCVRGCRALEPLTHIFWHFEWAHCLWFLSPLGFRMLDLNHEQFLPWLFHCVNSEEHEVVANIVCFFG